MSGKGFLSLPTELILKISDYLNPNDYLTLKKSNDKLSTLLTSLEIEKSPVTFVFFKIGSIMIYPDQEIRNLVEDFFKQRSLIFSDVEHKNDDIFDAGFSDFVDTNNIFDVRFSVFICTGYRTISGRLTGKFSCLLKSIPVKYENNDYFIIEELDLDQDCYSIIVLLTRLINYFKNKQISMNDLIGIATFVQFVTYDKETEIIGGNIYDFLYSLLNYFTDDSKFGSFIFHMNNGLFVGDFTFRYDDVVYRYYFVDGKIIYHEEDSNTVNHKVYICDGKITSIVDKKKNRDFDI